MWGKSLKNVKNFSMDRAKVFFTANMLVETNFSRGYKYFADGYITDVWTTYDMAKHESSIRAKCYRSMKKTGPQHSLSVIICDGNITEGHCTCLIGTSKACGHLVALCYTLQHFLLKNYTEIPEELSCTDLMQKWGKPRTRKVEPQCLLNMTIYSPSEKQKKKPPVTCTLRNAPTRNNIITVETISKAVTELKEIDENIGWSYLLTATPKKNVNLPLDLVGQKNSPLDVQCNCCEFGPSVNSEVTEYNLNDTESAAHYKHFPIYCEVRKQMFAKFGLLEDYSKLHLTMQQALDLEKATRGQSSSKRWTEERCRRFTASNFGEILNRKKIPNDIFLKRVLFNTKNLQQVASIRHGRKYESVAMNIYKRRYPTVQVFESGLVVNPEMPYLGASPDGHIVDMAEVGQENGVVEIKCPLWSNLYEGLNKGVSGYLLLSEKDGLFMLNHNSDYFAQIQGQMLITGANWCDFVIYIQKSNEINVERLYFDKDYSHNLLNKLHCVYKTYAVPFITREDKENCTNK